VQRGLSRRSQPRGVKIDNFINLIVVTKVMREVHLTYVERHPYGCEPSGVTFFAGLSPIKPSDDTIKLSLNHIVRTDSTPRQILQRLEKMVLEAVGEKPSVHDPIEGLPQDEQPKYADWPRQSGYLAEGSWPKKGETQEQANKRAKENTAIRNTKLLKLYQSFTESVSAEPRGRLQLT